MAWQVAGLALLAAALIGAAVWIGYNKRNSPERREQNRRLFVNREGRLGDAMIIDVIDDTLVYQYQVNGVSYTGSQDLSALRQLLPGGIDRLIGQVAIKYTLRNPANSIVLCEVWSGLRDLYTLQYGAGAAGLKKEDLE
ncbi:MAG TPA: hypothetical protein VGL53_08315 [Bryobacteraceae bacterium]|jgi:hypothetical protein